ncbi:MAG: hypothetical protein JF615_01335, partial [Asticcacaulis sp.]|nr:hypothetical protein [Asticcacaulis sp.]
DVTADNRAAPTVKNPNLDTKQRQADEPLQTRVADSVDNTNKTSRDVVADNRQAPSVSAPPSPNLGVKKKQKDEQLQARANDSLSSSNTAARNVTDLNLHEPPKIIAGAPPSPVAPSGLANDGGSRPAGGANGGLPPGALQGVNGSLKGGRSGVSQAIQNHNSCVSIQMKGKKTIPQSCNMTALADQPGLGLKPDAGLQAAAAAVDADLKYKGDAGSTELWDRVNASPQPGSAGRDDGLPKKGAYRSAKDQRVMTGSGGDPKNGQ